MKNYKYFILIVMLLILTSGAFALPKFSDNKTKIPPDPVYKNTIMIPHGYILNSEIKENIICNDVNPADNITAVLKNDFIYKGKVVAPEGSIITGKFVKKIVNGNFCKVKVKFTNIITPSGNNIPISAIFIEENSTGFINACGDGSLFKDKNADIIIKQPVTFIFGKSN